MRYLILSVLCTWILSAGVVAQTSQADPSSKYDADLAKKTGADEYGMKSYVFCILKTGPKDAEIKDKKQRDDIFAGHMANMNRLAK